MVPRERILIVIIAALACLGVGCSGPDFNVGSTDATDIGDASPEALAPLLCPHCQDPNPSPTLDAADDRGSADGGSDATMADGGARTEGGLDAAPRDDVATLNEAAPSNDATSAGGCSATQKMCASSCVSLDDPKYGCGSGPCIACSADPHATYACQAGACQATVCQTGYKSCGGVCVTADVAHGCGATACSACGASHGTASCDATGKCAISCDASYKPCGGVCVSVSDPTYGC
ncbi:MAG: hypothetical protein M3O46_00435, partial [Myxococcota bacterium]|nr:hypothetical protein [Myxococcota bacterium]